MELINGGGIVLYRGLLMDRMRSVPYHTIQHVKSFFSVQLSILIGFVSIIKPD